MLYVILMYLVIMFVVKEKVKQIQEMDLIGILSFHVYNQYV